MYMLNDFLIMLMHHYHEQFHHQLIKKKKKLEEKKTIKDKILGGVDPLRAASLRASGIEFGLVPFDERAGSSNSGTMSIADQSIPTS